ncbi:hypothetical protein VNI00_015830 [Paramarasmius palmivorus]|uniref:Glycoside hydrolase family 76 protein n=1 Tax=Paramarasmius palmivorus TaxID=297713 RepID=A0AAW0BHX4_9AGAR
MARSDSFTKQTKYRDQLKEFLGLANIADRTSGNTPSYGYAAAHAHKAYNDDSFLSIAQNVWNVGRTYTLSSSDVNAGSIGVKNFPIQKQCLDAQANTQATMAGGTFLYTRTEDPQIAAISTGSFFVLSSLLAEVTLNSTYRDAAIDSMQFIQSHLYFKEGLVRDGISARQNDSCGTIDFINPYNSGLAIEGMSILASVTQDSSSQKTYPLWQNADGVIAAWYDRGDENIVRGLSAVYERNGASSFRSYVEAYLAVQYHAVVDQAAGSNVYGTSWIGPPTTTFDGAGQTSGVTVLTAAIPLTQSSSGGGSSNGGNCGSNGQSRSSATSAGAIAGAAVGGGALVGLVGTVAFLCLRRQERRERKRQLGRPTPFHDTNTTSTDTKSPIPPATIESLPDTQSRPVSRSALTTMTPGAPVAPSVVHSSHASESGRNGDEISNAELYRLLSERLESGRWDTHISLPPYPWSSQEGSVRSGAVPQAR